MLPGRKSASQAGFGAGLLAGGKHRNRPSGRPKAAQGANFGVFPVAVRSCCVVYCAFGVLSLGMPVSIVSFTHGWWSLVLALSNPKLRVDVG